VNQSQEEKTTAKMYPMLGESPETMLFMPTTLPSRFTNGPPLLPIVMGASVWRRAAGV